MQKLAFLLAKLYKRLKGELLKPIDWLVSWWVFYSNNAQFSISSNQGWPKSTVCQNRNHIGRNVNLDGGVVIYDTDFPSLDASHRRDSKLDSENTRTAPVLIGDDVFIGGHSTILKGVTIGDGAVIGACSVVTRDVPAFEVWAGNPAKRVRNAIKS